MESLYFDLTEETDSSVKMRVILLWVFAGLFFVVGLSVLLMEPLLDIHEIKPSLSLAPFGVFCIFGTFAILDMRKKKDIYFSVNDDAIEYRYGMIRAKKSILPWNVIKRLIVPHKEKKLMFQNKDGKNVVIDFTWIEKKKAGIIRKTICSGARDKDLDIWTVNYLSELKQLTKELGE